MSQGSTEHKHRSSKSKKRVRSSHQSGASVKLDMDLNTLTPHEVFQLVQHQSLLHKMLESNNQNEYQTEPVAVVKKVPLSPEQPQAQIIDIQFTNTPNQSLKRAPAIPLVQVLQIDNQSKANQCGTDRSIPTTRTEPKAAPQKIHHK